jgi:tRNA(Ile)-lysidine synthase
MAAVRVAVRRALADVSGPVAAAVSGGADSLALAAALAFERPSSYALVVDHGLQEGSAHVAARAADQCRGLGLDTRVLSPDGIPPGAVGPEAVARELRYRLLEQAAHELGAAAVLLGHTLHDQAETVLLGLARGSGARSLAGMAATRGIFRRPLLALDRDTVRQACADAGLTPWEDPHNTDPTYSRVRVRRQALPVLEDTLGPGVAAGLARSARLLREDADALDAMTPDLPDEPACDELLALAAALRSRALKTWAERRSGRALTASHVDAMRALVEDWRGQGVIDVPGGGCVRRTAGVLRFDPG